MQCLSVSGAQGVLSSDGRVANNSGRTPTYTGNGLEYTLCWDSANRDVVAYPEPNDFVLPMASAGHGSPFPPVVSMYVGSAELPNSQWTIEEEWSTLAFDQGIPNAINAPGEEDNVVFSFSVTTGGVGPIAVDAFIPPAVNPITANVLSAPGEVTFTTQYPHGLAARACMPYVQLGGTTETDPAVINLKTNPSLVIVDDYNFTIALPAPPGNGFVSAGAPNPAELACALNAAFAAALTQIFPPLGLNIPVATMSYDFTTNIFTFTFTNGDPAALVVLTADASSLPTHMGFGLNAMLSVTTDGAPAVLSVTGNYGNSGCVGTLTLQPGNYTPETFAAELERAWNPFVFNGGVTADPADRLVFAFTNAMGAAFTFPIDYGTYTPTTFADYLTTQMNTADPSQTYTVTYDAMTGTLQFSSDLPFGLPFEDPAVSPLLVDKLGFDHVSYNGGTAYTSANLNYTDALCTSVPHLRSGNLRVLLKENQSMLCLYFSGAPCQTDTIVVAAGQGTIGPLPVAHGLQVGDLAALTTAAGTFMLPVVAVPDAFTVVVDMYAAPIGNGETVTLCDTASMLGSINLYLGNNWMLAQVMGFPASAVFSGADGSLCAAGCWNFRGPRYLLWAVTTPTSSAYIQHWWRARSDNRTNIFAKLILHNHGYAVERLYPMQQIIQGNTKLTELRMVLLNPDHSLYHFHQCDWSGTIVLVCAATSGAQLCY